jgi:transcriptional regulator with AAA-type ATPase domain
MLLLASTEVKYVKENFRSSSSNNQMRFNPLSYEEKYIEYLNIVEQKIIPYKTLIAQDITVHVLLQPDIAHNSDDNIFTFLSEAGLYIDDPSYDGYDQIYLRGYSKNNDVNIKSTIDGLNNIFNGLIEDGKENIIIHFPINNFKISESALFLTLFSTLTSMILFLINAETQLKKSLNIYWSFDESNIIELFKKVITKAKIIKVKSQIEEKTANQLQKRVHTQDEKYTKQLKSIAHIIDEVDVPILILGETGVGKSFLANIIHDASSRKGNFISLNCATIQDEMMESALFGIIKGSATGVSEKEGRIKAAEGGTLFLDEIDRASRKFRDTILTFIDTKEYTPVGSNTKIVADVRLLYGSNKDIQKLIDKNEFEIDFLYRIDNRRINIPPLRDRREDIEKIVEFVLKELNEKKGSDVAITSDVILMIKQMPLKGNIRDIQKIISKGFYDVLHEDKYGIISKEHFDGYEIEKDILSAEFNQQMEIARIFMRNYDNIKDSMNLSQNDKFFLIKDFIMPIFAHIFLNEIYDEKTKSPDKTLSEQICGSSMERGNAATIIKKSEEFKNLQNLF